MSLAHPAGRGTKGVLEILEEAVELLRQAPLSALGAYYFGSIPFCLGLLYFWADMSRSSDAFDLLSQEAFELTFLFIWMKTWQTLYARVLWNHLSKEPGNGWTFGGLSRMVLTQAVFQPWGFLVIPIGTLFLIPTAWVYAFFQNMTVLGEGSEKSLVLLYRKTWRLTGLWPRQNNLIILCVSCFSFFLFINLACAILTGPELLKSVFGIETMFSRSVMSLFNTTFLAILCVLTYLSVDPLIKAVYTLRCFYGDSLSKGEDLKADLKTVNLPVRTLVVMGVLGWGTHLFAQNSISPGDPSINSDQLDRAITETLNNDEYRWHMPREIIVDENHSSENNAVSRFLEGSLRFLIQEIRSAGRGIEKVLEWIAKYFRPDFKGTTPKSGDYWDFEWVYGFLWILLAAALCALSLLIYRLWRRRESPGILSQPVQVMPDVSDERVSGSELPMDGWIQMADELFQNGQFRLALRAHYLATLVCLAQHKFLTIAKFKSTMDYDREFNRRAHGHLPLLFHFSESSRLFDRGWYGEGEVTRGMVENFALFHQKIETFAESPQA